ncbi:hypothetical protein GH733_017461 [Mirounga leonina]|nr:hypothetical protein GH733_017461 [Mirounga leonina]
MGKETAPRTIFQRVLDILKKSSHAVELACRDPSQVEHLASSLQLITECFRCLRNACIECSGIPSGVMGEGKESLRTETLDCGLANASLCLASLAEKEASVRVSIFGHDSRTL